MDWKEWLAKFRLIDITPKAEGKQVGGINVNYEDKSDNRIYNYHFHSPEAARAFAASKVNIDAEFENRVKEEVERRLTNLGIQPDLLTEKARMEITLATTAASSMSIAGIEAPDRAEIVIKAEEPED